MLNNLLVYIPSESLIRPILDGAISLAVARAAHLQRIGIAWDGSRLAARAVRDAAPFLTRGQVITIISINEAQELANASAEVLVTHLARHGLIARTERATADYGDIQPTILSIAADTGLDLIGMGGYGHSRLGGVTRGMLQSMAIPTLMSH